MILDDKTRMKIDNLVIQGLYLNNKGTFLNINRKIKIIIPKTNPVTRNIGRFTSKDLAFFAVMVEALEHWIFCALDL